MPRIEHKMMGEYHVFTSPDLKGLYVANRDRAKAEATIQPTIDVLRRMEAKAAEMRKSQDVLSPA